MTTDENVAILREAYRLWDESKAEAAIHWIDLMADDVHWRSIVDENSPGMHFAKDCTCKSEVLEYFQKLGEEWELAHYTVHEFIAQNDRVVALCECGWRNRRTGRDVDSPKVDIFRMRDGKIVDFCEFYDNSKAIAASIDE